MSIQRRSDAAEEMVRGIGEMTRRGRILPKARPGFLSSRPMYDLSWSASEKKVARSAYEHALQSALGKLMTEVKARAASIATPAEMWALENYLRQQRRDIDDIFDYRYSRLLMVFARLIHEGHLDEAGLSGLSEEKLEIIRRLLSR
jgi:Photoprotection regulator fluorescence recovery protein